MNNLAPDVVHSTFLNDAEIAVALQSDGVSFHDKHPVEDIGSGLDLREDYVKGLIRLRADKFDAVAVSHDEGHHAAAPRHDDDGTAFGEHFADAPEQDIIGQDHLRHNTASEQVFAAPASGLQSSTKQGVSDTIALKVSWRPSAIFLSALKPEEDEYNIA